MGDLTISAEGDLGTGSVAISAGTNCDCSVGTIAAGDMTLLVSNDLTIPAIGDLITVSGQLKLDVGGDLTMADITAGRLNFEGVGGSITGADINVTDRVGGDVQGAIVLGNITAGPGLPTSGDNFSVGIASETSVTVGNVTAAGNVGFVSSGNDHRRHQRRGSGHRDGVGRHDAWVDHDGLGWPSLSR